MNHLDPHRTGTNAIIAVLIAVQSPPQRGWLDGLYRDMLGRPLDPTASA